MSKHLKMSERERRYYMLALTTMAAADNKAASEELAYLQRKCKQLKCRLTKKDFKQYDLGKIAKVIDRAEIQSALFEDLIKMAKKDRKWDPAELSVLKYFASTWKLTPPAIQGVDWAQVSAPDEGKKRELSAKKRERLEQRQDVAKATDPGMRWAWVLISIVVFLAANVGAYLAAGKWWKPIDVDTIAAAEPLMFVILLAPSLVCGLLVGLISPGRTVREPAIGILVVTLAVLGFFALAVLPAAEGDVDATLWGVAGGTVVGMFVLGLVGAWLGETVTGN